MLSLLACCSTPASCGTPCTGLCGGTYSLTGNGTITDDNGTHTLTNFRTGWIQSGNVTTLTSAWCDPSQTNCAQTVGSGSVPYNYQLICIDSTQADPLSWEITTQYEPLQPSACDGSFGPQCGFALNGWGGSCGAPYDPNYQGFGMWYNTTTPSNCSSTAITGSATVDPWFCSSSTTPSPPVTTTFSYSLEVEQAGTGCQTFCVKCGFLNVSGATVSVYDHSGGTLLASGITDSGGCISLIWKGSLTVYVTVTVSNVQSYNGTLALTGGATTIIPVTRSNQQYHFTVYTPCAGGGGTQPIPGSTLTLDGSTYTADSNGVITWNVPGAGSYPWTISAYRYADSTGTMTVDSSCNVTNDPSTAPPLTVANGYACIGCYSGQYEPSYVPVSVTLHGTDSVYGAFTLTYDPTQLFWCDPATCNAAVGVFAYHWNVPASPGCAAADNVGFYYGPNHPCVPFSLGLSAIGGPCPASNPPNNSLMPQSFETLISFSAAPNFMLVVDSGTSDQAAYPAGSRITLTE